jgi:hypothetical protein
LPHYDSVSSAVSAASTALMATRQKNYHYCPLNYRPPSLKKSLPWPSELQPNGVPWTVYLFPHSAGHTRAPRWDPSSTDNSAGNRTVKGAIRGSRAEMEMDAVLRGEFCCRSRGRRVRRGSQPFLDEEACAVGSIAHIDWSLAIAWFIESSSAGKPRISQRPEQDCQDRACQLAFIGIMTVEGILMNGSGTEPSIPGVGSAYYVGLLPR